MSASPEGRYLENERLLYRKRNASHRVHLLIEHHKHEEHTIDNTKYETQSKSAPRSSHSQQVEGVIEDNFGYASFTSRPASPNMETLNTVVTHRATKSSSNTTIEQTVRVHVGIVVPRESTTATWHELMDLMQGANPAAQEALMPEKVTVPLDWPFGHHDASVTSGAHTSRPAGWKSCPKHRRKPR